MGLTLSRPLFIQIKDEGMEGMGWDGTGVAVATAISTIVAQLKRQFAKARVASPSFPYLNTSAASFLPPQVISKA